MGWGGGEYLCLFMTLMIALADECLDLLIRYSLQNGDILTLLFLLHVSAERKCFV